MQRPRRQDGFNNSSAGMTGGRTELGVSGSYQVNEKLSLNAELLHSEDRISAARVTQHLLARTSSSATG
jgi:hypothetical protein